MNHSHWPRTLALAAAVLCAGTASFAQDATQQRYERRVAACNSGSLAAPEREACIRAAGNALDAARGAPASQAPVPTPDGRATVVVPQGTRTPATGSDVRTTPDGRASVVPPSDRSAPR